MKDVSFKYPTSKEFAVLQASCQVTLGSRVAIIGKNGAGKSTLLALLCGELRPTADSSGKTGEVIRCRTLRLAFIAQHHMFHLGDYSTCTPAQYIQLRFTHGYDEELQKRLMSPADETEEATLQALAARYGKYGKRVAE